MRKISLYIFKSDNHFECFQVWQSELQSMTMVSWLLCYAEMFFFCILILLLRSLKFWAMSKFSYSILVCKYCVNVICLHRVVKVNHLLLLFSNVPNVLHSKQPLFLLQNQTCVFFVFVFTINMLLHLLWIALSVMVSEMWTMFSLATNWMNMLFFDHVSKNLQVGMGQSVQCLFQTVLYISMGT